MEKDKTSNDTLWVAFDVRSVVARVTVMWMDTTSTAVRIDVVKDAMSAGEAREDASVGTEWRVFQRSHMDRCVHVPCVCWPLCADCAVTASPLPQGNFDPPCPRVTHCLSPRGWRGLLWERLSC